MLLEHDVNAAKESMCVNAFVLFLLLIVFMANFYVLVPYLFEAKNKIKHWAFWVINLLFIVLWNHHIFSIYNADLPNAPIRIGFYQWCDVDDSQLCDGRCGYLRALLYPP